MQVAAKNGFEFFRALRGAKLCEANGRNGMTFKDCVMEDIERVFFDLTEFGEEHLVDGKKAVVVLEDDDTREHNSHWEAGAKQNFDTGLYSAQMILYIKKADYGPKPKVGKLLELDGGTIDAGFTRLQEQERMQCSELAGLTACYLPELYEAETYVCRRILSMAEAELPEPKRLDALLETIEDRQEIDYAPEQLAAIRAAAAQQLLIVTGGPGTGKTTVMAGILQLFDELKLKTQLAAPTGRAAKRLSEVTGREASTIHRLLEAQFDEQTGAMALITMRMRRSAATR